jgi:cell fate regulator YaaT (PSP1 superfamily)
MAVSFSRYGRLYYLDAAGFPGEIAVGDKVLVPTDEGTEVAECIWAPQWTSDEIGGLPAVAGLATEADLERDELNRRRTAQTKVAIKRLVREHGLPMKPVAVDVRDRADPPKVVIYFSAPHRVDFRALLRDLYQAAPATPHACRAASALAAGTCAARRSSPTSSRSASGWPRTRTCRSTR